MIRIIDSQIADFVGNKTYTAYVPHTHGDLTQILVTHPSCHKLAIIEEGMLQYSSDPERYLPKINSTFLPSFWDRLKQWIKYPIHLNRLLAYRSYESFIPIPVYILQRKETTHPSVTFHVVENITLPPIEYEFNYHDAIFLLFSAEVEQGIVKLQYYIESLDHFIDKYFDKSQPIFVKFHPSQKIKIELVDYMNRKGVNYIILPADTCLEFIFIKYKNLRVYGFVSSLLFYASMWGHSSYSLIGLLYKIDPNIKSRLGTNLDKFLERVQLLK